MLELQIQLLTVWWTIGDTIHERLRAARDDERGEMTAGTIMIVILSLAALAAGGIIAQKINDNANNIPSP